METTIPSISKSAPQDISIDFERLRQEGIGYLEELATYIWTDFNVHDPGITLLEVLCYAITDLGYRANLPIEDILAAGKQGNTSFFTALEILPVYPITQNDYRKILIDFPGVRNAWIERACPNDVLIYIKKKKVYHEIADDLKNWLIGDIANFERITEEVKAEIAHIETQLNTIKDSNGNTIKPSPISKADITRLRRFTTSVSEDDEIRTALFAIADKLEKYLLFFNSIKEYYTGNYQTISNIDTILAKYKFPKRIPQNLKEVLKNLPSENEAAFIGFIENLFLQNLTDEAIAATKLFDEINCHYRYIDIDFARKLGGFTETEIATEDNKRPNYERVCLNGLYHICLDPYKPFEVDCKEALTLIEQVKKGYTDKTTGKCYKGLYDYRNLCEDFYDVKIAPIQEVNLCLDAVIEPEADEKEVMANIIYRLQSFLTPSVPFYSFKQLLEKGKSCDDIFNGPLLNNGFIDDTELAAAVIPQKIHLSDLYKVILETPHVESINSLKTKKKEDVSFEEIWCVNYTEEDHICPTKPIIDIANSKLCIEQNGISQELSEAEIIEFIQLLQLSSRNLIGGEKQVLCYPKGDYREDLAEFISTQYELPHNYAVGENGLPDAATPLRQAQVKQLQAFMLFFDKLLADYLQQLKSVRDLLSVDQDPTTATYFYQSLYEVPGVKELINDYVYEINTVGINALKAGTLPKSVIDNLQNLVDSTSEKKITYLGIEKFAKAMGGNPDDKSNNGILGASWLVYKNELKAAFHRPFLSEEEWQQYQADDQNSYIQQLAGLIETTDGQYNRKQKITNHLLARFGEQFTTYAVQVFGDKAHYLEAKTDFLKSIPELGVERAKGYNYRLKDKVKGDYDVWNTDNVAGLKKRIYRLLGWGAATTESVLTDPDYILLDEEDRSKELHPHRFIKLYKKIDDERKELLLTSDQSYPMRRIKNMKQQLYILINNQENYNVEPANGGQFRVEFKVKIKVNRKDEEIKFVSIAMSEPDAYLMRKRIQNVVNAKIKGGFHLIEHLLLRPNDAKDQILKSSFTCDLQFPPIEPYSFWMSVLVPAWQGQFKDQEYRSYFMQLMRYETPAHIALCFKWVEEEDIMEQLEFALEQWREALAKCTPDECDVTEKANILIDLLNQISCECYCFDPQRKPTKC